MFTYDRRGGRNSLELLARDLLAAVEASGGEPVALWGFSQGGWIAPLAATRSDRVACLVLAASTGVSPAEQMRFGAAFHLREAGFGEDVVRRAVELRLAVEEYLRGRAPRPAVQARVDAVSDEPWFELAFLPVDSETGGLPPVGSWADLDFDPRGTFAGVRVPTLLFYGEEDEWIPIEASIEAWREAPADVTVVRLPGTRHVPTLEGRDEVDAVTPLYTETLVAWLREHLTPGRS